MARSKHVMVSGKVEHAKRPDKSVSIIPKAAINGPCRESLMLL